MKADRMRFLKIELEGYRKALNQASETIYLEGVSEYPIMVVHQSDIQIGIPIIDREKVKGNWSVNASTMEEFLSRNLLLEEKLEEFRQTFAAHRAKSVCVFLVEDGEGHFLFLPR